MYRIVKRALRVVNSGVGSFSGSSSCSSTLTKRHLTCFAWPVDLQKCNDVRGDFMKWGSLGSCRRSSFASGYEPLKQKPLGSIIDIRRAELQSPEDLADIWDDMPHMIFTGLEDYKAKGTEATPYFTVSYYTEFAETKDLVLIRGDIVFASKLTDSEAKWLVETTQSFYLNDNRYKLIERFNKHTRDFEFKDVLQALDITSL
uniref:ATP synthase mitochondrial F1 complex assembly factor 1 n=1 Tax=Daucus carota subsp. sativus TaxID=79200 RepID=A0A166IQA5_DAUCS